MPPMITVLLFSALASVLHPSYQQILWWSSETDVFDYYTDNIYDTLTGNITISPNSTFRSHSWDLRYGARYNIVPESYRDPDRVRFSASVYDKLNDINYTAGLTPNDELTAFKWSHGFVHENDVFYAAAPEKPPIKITNAEETKMIYGAWNYMANGELGFIQLRIGSMWFSPDDKFLVYRASPMNATKKIVLTTYDRKEKYDYHYEKEFAKPGEDITVASLFIWSAEEGKQKKMDVHLSDPSSFPYLFGVSWVTLHGRDLLVATWANRWQNHTTMTICTFETGACEMIYEHKYKHAQWASPVDYAHLAHSNSAIFILLPEVAENNSWQHIAKLEISAEFKVDSISMLPSGTYDIREIVAYRAAEDIVIYDAQAPHLWNRHIYGTPAGFSNYVANRLSPSNHFQFQNRSALTIDQCLTCVSPNCTFQEKATVSPAHELKIALSCYGPSQPYIAVLAFNETLHLQDIQKFITNKNEQEMPEMTTETFLLPSGYEAIVPNLPRRHPPLLCSRHIARFSSLNQYSRYGGAMDFNQVTDEFNPNPKPTGFKHAVVFIDVRGSAGRGWNYKSGFNGRLVTVEVEDTYEAMKMVLAKYPRLDKSRVGVYGGSYGGTMTIALVEKAPPSFFKCAMSICPVTNFVNYNAGYSERFMGDTPLSSYTDLTRNVTAFEHTKLLLAHGLRDSNVPFQHSALFIEALQRANIPFELMVYPNQDQRIDQGVSAHLQHLSESFFSKCYEQAENDPWLINN